MKNFYQKIIKLTVLMIILILSGCTKSEIFLSNTIFFWGNKYALFVHHPKHGTFLVDDEAILKANRQKVKIKRSGWDFLPAGVNRHYGLRLFRNGKQIKSYTGNNLKIFEIGNLAAYGKPLKRRSFEGNMVEIKKKLKQLSAQKNAYIIDEPKFEHEKIEHIFKIVLPDIAVTLSQDTPVFDNQLSEQEWKKQWKQKLNERIKNIIGSTSDYKIRHLGFGKAPVYLIDYSNEKMRKFGGEILLDSSGEKNLTLDYEFYRAEIEFTASYKIAKRLQKLDFSSLISKEERNKPQLIEAAKEAIKKSQKSNLSIEKGEVGFSHYNDEIYMTNIEQPEYEIVWLEVLSKDVEK